MEDESISNTDVFLGPLTLAEIRYHLASTKPREMISRRATISISNPSRTVYSDSPTQDYLIKRQFFDGDPEDLSSSFVSEYLTPNKTLHNDKSLTTNNVYATPCPSIQNSTKDDDISSSLTKSFNKADNIMKPYNNYDCSTPSRSLINKDEENLDPSSSSLYASAGEFLNFNIQERADVPKFSLSQICKGIRDSQYLKRLNDIILVSSDDESVLEATDEPNEQLTQSRLQYAEKIDLETVDLPKDDILNLPTPSKSPICDHNDCSTSLLCAHNSSNVIDDRSNVSPSSLQESSGYGFNDTLEEMKMALKHGLDYKMSDETTENDNTDDTATSDYFQQNQFPYSSKVHSDKLGTGLSTNKPNPTNDNFKKTLIPVKSSQTNITPQKPMRSIQPLPTKQNFNFKVPYKPVTNYCKTPDFKNVISPVAVYIKNSPKVPQVQRVLGKPLKIRSLFPNLPASTISNKENDQLPFRLYKPAKHAIVSKQKELKLPGSVQKYIPNTPDIIKHQRRVAKKTTNSISVEENLLKEDLTMCDTDASLSSSTLSLQDVSLQTSRKAYIQ